MRIAPRSPAFTILLGILAGLPALSIDISAPTLVILPAALGTTTVVAGLTLSLFMVGFAAGQLGGGYVSDRAGRRPVLLASIAVFMLAGIACAFSSSGPALVAARMVQGIGAGSCSVLAFATVQDLFEGPEALSKRSYVTVVFGVVPVLAPALGAWLSQIGGWRSVHVVLAAAGGVLLAVVWAGVAESRRMQAPPVTADTRGRSVFEDWQFLSLAAVNALSYGALFAYIAGLPVVIIGQMGISPGIYAGMFACTALALTAGAWTNARLSKRGFETKRLLWPSFASAAVATLGLAVASINGITAGPLILPLLLVTCFARGIIAPNLQHIAVALRHHDAGFASAIIGVTQLLTGAASSAVVAALLPSYGQLAVAGPMAILAGSAALLWLYLTRRRTRVRDQPINSPVD